MGRLKCRGVLTDQAVRERDLRNAINFYNSGGGTSIRDTAEKYGVAYTTLRDRLAGAKSRQEAHREQQYLTDEEEKAIVRFCLKVDDWGHPLRISYLKALVTSIVPPSKRRRLGKHWVTRFLNRHPELASKFVTRLERQRQYSNNPKLIQDFFWKVC